MVESKGKADSNVVYSTKIGKYQATIFRNERTSKSGNTFETHNVQLQKSWLKADGDAKNKDDWESQKMSLFNAQEVRQCITALEDVEKHLLKGE